MSTSMYKRHWKMAFLTIPSLPIPTHKAPTRTSVPFRRSSRLLLWIDTTRVCAVRLPAIVIIMSSQQRNTERRQRQMMTAAPRQGAAPPQQRQPMRRPPPAGVRRPPPPQYPPQAQPSNQPPRETAHQFTIERPPPAVTVEEQHPPPPPATVDANAPEFIGALQRFAQASARKTIADLEAEFRQLQAMPKPEPSEEFKRNPKSNRYKDVLCVEQNRVQLANGRYIHANWIDTNGERRFICTQGPLPTTCDDFWTMIVQERVNAIVMLCDCIELGRQKCHQYWPTKDAKNVSFANGTIAVTYLQEDHVDGNIYRVRLNVATADKQLIVRHFHWRQWPDRGVPSSHLAVLRLLHVIQNYSPVVVHCSAGIGRTGTVVAVYLAQRRLRAGQDLDIHDMLLELRQQRAQSVQTVEQYLFIYNAMLRFIINKAHNIPAISNEIEALNQLVDAIAARFQGQGR